MPGFGLPCPEEPQPDTVFDNTAEINTILSSIINDIFQMVGSGCVAVQTCLQPVINQLQQQITNNLNTITSYVNNISTVLNNVITTNNMVLTSNVSEAIQNIANTLNITTNEVIYGSTTINNPPTPFPPSPWPPTPTPWPPTPQPHPPHGPPVIYPPAPWPPQPIQIINQITCNGCATPVTPVCPPIPAPQPITVNNYQYNLTFSVVNNGSPITTTATGAPNISLSYDVQVDGSIAVNIGPITVLISLPPVNPADNPPVCPLNFIQ